MSSSTGSSSTGLSTLQEPVAPPVAATRAIARASDNLLLNQAGMQVVLQTAPPTKGTGHQQRGLAHDGSGAADSKRHFREHPSARRVRSARSACSRAAGLSAAHCRQRRRKEQPAAASSADSYRRQRSPRFKTPLPGASATLVASAVPVQPVAELPLVSGVLPDNGTWKQPRRQQRGLMPAGSGAADSKRHCGEHLNSRGAFGAAQPVAVPPLPILGTQPPVAQVSDANGIQPARAVVAGFRRCTPATTAPAILLAPAAPPSDARGGRGAFHFKQHFQEHSPTVAGGDRRPCRASYTGREG